MCSGIGMILRRNASTYSSHCRHYADGAPNFHLPTFSIFEANTVAAYDNPQVAAEMLVQSALDAISDGQLTLLATAVMALPVLPSVVITDMGLVNGANQTFVPVFADAEA